MDVINAEHFIEQIKQKEAIWDSSSENYKNKNLKQSQWFEIGSVFHPNFENLDSKEKLNCVKELQVKWKNIRDAYSRYLKSIRTKSGQGLKFVKTYVYAEPLEFLRDIITPCETEGTLQPQMSAIKVEKEDEVATSVSSNPDDVESAVVGTKYSASTIHRRKKRSLEQKIENYIDNFKHPRVEEPNRDDLDFFRSLVPLINSFTIQEKIKYRMDVMKLTLQHFEKKSNLNQITISEYSQSRNDADGYSTPVLSVEDLNE